MLRVAQTDQRRFKRRSIQINEENRSTRLVLPLTVSLHFYHKKCRVYSGLITTISGSIAGDIDDGYVTESTNGEFYMLSLSKADKNTMLDSGLVRLIAQ